MTTKERWDLLDKRIIDYAKKQQISEVQVDERLVNMIRKFNIDMYEAMDILEENIMDKFQSKQIWSSIFDTKNIDGLSNAELCAEGLMAWENIFMGEIHSNFGEVVALIAERFNILGTHESFMKKAKEYH